MIEWHDGESKPTEAMSDRSRSWEFLCDVIIPERYSEVRHKYIVLEYDKIDKHWDCEGMIVTRWAEINS